MYVLIQPMYTNYLEYPVNLIEVGFPRHERLAQQQLAQDTPGRPEINGGGVGVAPQEQLGTPIPKRNHLRKRHKGEPREWEREKA